MYLKDFLLIEEYMVNSAQYMCICQITASYLLCNLFFILWFEK